LYIANSKCRYSELKEGEAIFCNLIIIIDDIISNSRDVDYFNMIDFSKIIEQAKEVTKNGWNAKPVK